MMTPSVGARELFGFEVTPPSDNRGSDCARRPDQEVVFAPTPEVGAVIILP
jgi:hypothetical protein